MLALKPATPGDDIAQYAGVVVDALTDTVPNGRLPIDGSLVKIANFPKLFGKIGHIFTSGSFAGNGSEGATFRLPNPAGRIFKPRDDGTLPGTAEEDKTIQHTHQVDTLAGAHTAHTMTNTPSVPGPIGFRSENYNNPNSLVTLGNYGTTVYTSDISGAHQHTFTLGNGGGAETRPYAHKIPAYIITGEASDSCVAIIYGRNWAVTPGYNEVNAAKAGIEDRLARENIHAYRIRYPEVTTAATLATAHAEVARQLAKLRTMYKNVWVLGIGTGAHLGALAMTMDTDLWLANKFVGVNGVYDLTAPTTGPLYVAMSAYLGGVTPELRAQGTPVKPYYPARCYHGANNTISPTSQSSNWCTDTVIVPDLPNETSPATAGLMDAIIAFFKS